MLIVSLSVASQCQFLDKPFLSLFIMSSRMPSTPVLYRDYRLSPVPIRASESKFQRFVPQAVSAGWFPAGPAPVVALEVVSEDFIATNPPTGFLQHATLMTYLDAHLGRLCFSCDAAGDYYFNLSYRSANAVVRVELLSHLDGASFIFFGYALRSGLLFVCLFNNASRNAPTAHFYDQVTSVIDVVLTGPTRPDSQYIAVSRVSYFVPLVVPVPG
jgi:hypothetical protein